MHTFQYFIISAYCPLRFMNLPGHHVAHAGPSTPAHKETHCWVCDSVPGPAHKQDDGGIEGIQLELEMEKKKEKGEAQNPNKER